MEYPVTPDEGDRSHARPTALSPAAASSLSGGSGTAVTAVTMAGAAVTAVPLTPAVSPAACDGIATSPDPAASATASVSARSRNGRALLPEARWGWAPSDLAMVGDIRPKSLRRGVPQTCKPSVSG